MKKWLIGSGILGVLLVTVLIGSLAATAFAQTPSLPQAQTEGQADAGPDEQAASYDSAIRVDGAQYGGLSEADEATALGGLATITPEQAKTAALQAHPGTTALKVELDNENGALVYSVELDNGMDVKVDAGTGAILGADQEEADSEAGDVGNVQEEIQNQDDDSGQEGNDLDSVQEEFENQADDAQEAPVVEDTPGQ